MFFNLKYSNQRLTLTELVTMERKSYCCNTCHKPLKCYSSLRTHQKLHNKYGEFVCHICGADFIWKGSFISHASFHVRAGDALNTEVSNFISNEFFIYSVHYALTPILRYFHAVCCLHESGNSALPDMFGIVDQSGITESVKLTSCSQRLLSHHPNIFIFFILALVAVI
ncbi:Zinc finger protein [Trichinella sp. T6]|nr:Zinc finger protein [Trichinella sp. T6]